MQKETITKFKWFWAWQDEKEEEWLGEMAAQGLHLDGFDFPTLYRFRKGEPVEFVYRLNYPGVIKKDRESYLQLFEDTGWEHVCEMGGWVYFRRQIQPGEPTEIFTDVESKVRKYQRVLMYLIIFLPIWLVVGPNFEANSMTLFDNVVFVLYTAMTLLWAFAIINLIRRVRQLQGS
jgi:hypothetical protein